MSVEFGRKLWFLRNLTVWEVKKELRSKFQDRCLKNVVIGFGATTGMENDKAGIRDPQICPQGHCTHPSWHQASLSSGQHFKPQKVRSSLKGLPVLPLCPGKPCTTTFPDLFSYVDYDNIIFYKVQSFCSGCWWPRFVLTMSCWSCCSPCRAFWDGHTSLVLLTVSLALDYTPSQALACFI